MVVAGLVLLQISLARVKRVPGLLGGWGRSNARSRLCGLCQPRMVRVERPCREATCGKPVALQSHPCNDRVTQEVRLRVLVTGGAGYIGSHACAVLLNAGHEVVIVDNLSRGHRRAVDILAARAPGRVRLVQTNLSDADAVRFAFHPGVDAVMHFAAFANVGEGLLIRTDPPKTTSPRSCRCSTRSASSVCRG